MGTSGHIKCIENMDIKKEYVVSENFTTRQDKE